MVIVLLFRLDPTLQTEFGGYTRVPEDAASTSFYDLFPIVLEGTHLKLYL